jgi:hypothetical protein
VGFMFYIHCFIPEHLSWYGWLWGSCFTYIVLFRSTWVDTVDCGVHVLHTLFLSGAPELTRLIVGFMLHNLYSVFCLVFYIWMFVLLSFFCWPFYCLYFCYLRLLLTPLVLVFSYFSCVVIFPTKYRYKRHLGWTSTFVYCLIHVTLYNNSDTDICLLIYFTILILDT